MTSIFLLDSKASSARNKKILDALTDPDNRLRGSFSLTPSGVSYNMNKPHMQSSMTKNEMIYDFAIHDAWNYTPISVLTSTLSFVKSSYNQYISTSEQVAAYALNIIAIRSAFFARKRVSLYDIFKNAEKLIPAIVQEDNTNVAERSNDDSSLHTLNNLYYYQASSRYILNLEDILKFYKPLIPVTHIDNLTEEAQSIYKNIYLVNFESFTLNVETKRITIINDLEKYESRWQRYDNANTLFEKYKTEFEQLAKSFDARAKKLNLSEDIQTSLMIEHINTYSSAQKTAEYSEKFIENAQYIRYILEETTDVEFTCFYSVFINHHTFVRSQNSGASMLIILGEALAYRNEDERKTIYHLVKVLSLDFTYQKPTLKTLKEILKVENLDIDELPVNIIFLLNIGEELSISKVKKPVINKAIADQFNIPIS